MKNKVDFDKLTDEMIKNQPSHKQQAQQKSARKARRQHGYSDKPSMSASEQLDCLKRAQQHVKSSNLFRAVFLLSGLLVSLAAYFLVEAGQLVFIPLPALIVIALMQVFFNFQVGKAYRHYLRQQEPG